MFILLVYFSIYNFISWEKLRHVRPIVICDMRNVFLYGSMFNTQTFSTFHESKEGANLLHMLGLQDSVSALSSTRLPSRNRLFEYHHFIIRQDDTMFERPMRRHFLWNPPSLVVLIPFLPKKKKTLLGHPLLYCHSCSKKTTRCFVVVSLALSLFSE